MKHTVAKFLSGPRNIKLSFPVNIKEEHKGIFLGREYVTRTQQIYSLKNVKVTDRGVVLSGLKRFDNNHVNSKVKKKYNLAYLIKVLLTYSKVDIDHEKKYVLTFDPWAAVNYYHWVIDTLPRIFLVKELLADSVLLLPRNAKKYMYESVKYFEPKETYEFKKHTYAVVPKLYIPSPLVDSFVHDGEALLELKDFIIKRVVEKENNLFKQVYSNKIYISRKGQKYRKIINENDVCQILERYGFAIVCFEELSFDEQVKLMINAKYVVTSHGANLTNILFMPSGGKVLELNRETSPVLCFWSLASSINLNYFYQLCSVVGSRNPVDNNADLYVNINELQKNIENMLLS